MSEVLTVELASFEECDELLLFSFLINFGVLLYLEFFAVRF